MPLATPSPEAALASTIPASVLAIAVGLLQAALPAVPGVTHPDLIRDGILHMLAAFKPETAAEVMLAAQAVAMQAQVFSSTASAGAPDLNPKEERAYRVMAAKFARAAQDSVNLLLRLQTRRAKAAVAVDFARSSASSVAPPDHVCPDPSPDAVKAPCAAAGKPPGYPALDKMTEAERYAVAYPDRAMLIRAHGGVPDNIPFDRPRRAIVRGLVRGRGPVFAGLDIIANTLSGITACTTQPSADTSAVREVDRITDQPETAQPA